MNEKNADKLQIKQFKKDRLYIQKQISVIEHKLAQHEMFKRNPNLKKAGVKIPYSKYQLNEVIKCSQDPVYFINNYCYIVNLDEGLIKFQTRKYQSNLINIFHNNKRIVVKFPRQTGKTVSTAAYAVWQAIFEPIAAIAILANKQMTAVGILQKVRLIYENLPSWMQVGVITWNKGSIELENGSEIKASSTSSSAIRSMSISTLIIDECAFIQPGIWGEFFASVYPTVSSSKKSKIILISTPKGMNHFYKFWTEANNKDSRSDFVPYEIAWDTPPGRDEAFKKSVIAEFSRSYWDQEFECIFLGSSGTLISGNKLRLLTYQSALVEKFDYKFKIYELPIKENKEIGQLKDARYVALVDTGEGAGIDFSVVQVFRIDEKPYKQVAIYKSNMISIREFPLIVEKIGLLYNEALVIAENNTIGESILNDLVYDLEYDFVFYQKKFGINMNVKTKSLGNSNLKTNIEDDHFIITDYDTIEELTTYVRKKKINITTYAAEKNKHDDTVTPLVIFSYFLRNKTWVEDWLDQEREAVSEKAKEAMIEDLLPIGFVNNGTNTNAIGKDDKSEEFFMPFA
jgi:hypothetical protein